MSQEPWEGLKGDRTKRRKPIPQGDRLGWLLVYRVVSRAATVAELFDRWAGRFEALARYPVRDQRRMPALSRQADPHHASANTEWRRESPAVFGSPKRRNKVTTRTIACGPSRQREAFTKKG